MTTAALYVRVSTRQQAEEGFSLEDQQRVLTELANDRGWDFRLYVDAGSSSAPLSAAGDRPYVILPSPHPIK